MQTTQLTQEQVTARPSAPRRPRRALRVWLGAALVVGTLGGAVGLHNALDHRPKKPHNGKVFPVWSDLDDTDRANWPGGPSNPPTGAIRSPDAANPVVSAPGGDPADAANQLPQGGSGGD